MLKVVVGLWQDYFKFHLCAFLCFPNFLQLIHITYTTGWGGSVIAIPYFLHLSSLYHGLAILNGTIYILEHRALYLFSFTSLRTDDLMESYLFQST